MISTPEFILKDIEDQYVRENFKRLTLFLQAFPLFRGEWQFFEITTTKAETNLKVFHGLGFKPTDVIQTSITGAGAITFNYGLFSDESLDITTTDACVTRCFVGAYKEESSRTGR
jgi:hypothetical protein